MLRRKTASTKSVPTSALSSYGSSSTWISRPLTRPPRCRPSTEAASCGFGQLTACCSGGFVCKAAARGRVSAFAELCSALPHEQLPPHPLLTVQCCTSHGTLIAT
eukprot:3499737-Pleurochrysis_carterae.AAC.4